MNASTNWKGVPEPENVMKAEATGFQDDPYVVGWRDGVDAALLSRKDEPDTGRVEIVPAQDVNAFALMTEDRPDEARTLVRDLSGKDRAVLSFHLFELIRIVQEEDSFRTMADRRRARLSHPDSGPDPY